MERKHFDIIIIVLIVVLILVIGYIGIVSRSDGGQCLEDPLGYSEKLSGENFNCVCMGVNRLGNFVTYYPKNSSQDKS